MGRRGTQQGSYRTITLEQLPGWETIRGLQFESLVAQNIVTAILDKLNLHGMLIEHSGPYFRNRTARQEAVQIDYLIQTAHALYVCETKVRKLIGVAVVKEVQEKIRRLAAPKEITVRKILIYSGERERALQEDNYFDRQICVDELRQMNIRHDRRSAGSSNYRQSNAE